MNEALIKFVVPKTLKRALQELASERYINLSSVRRLTTSEICEAQPNNMIISIANQKEGVAKSTTAIIS